MKVYSFSYLTVGFKLLQKAIQKVLNIYHINIPFSGGPPINFKIHLSNYDKCMHRKMLLA